MDNEETYGAPDGFVLAIAYAGGARFLGYLPTSALLGAGTVMRDCCELRAGLLPLLTEQGPVASSQVIPCFVDGTTDFTYVPLCPQVIRTVKNMEKDEIQKYVAARQQLAQRAMQNKADRAGITLATKLPKIEPVKG